MNFEEYYLREDLEEPEDSVEEPEDDYGLDFVDDEKFTTDEIEVEEIPDLSDPILNADEFMKSNSEVMSHYAKGKGFEVIDNQDLYEVVKTVKDMTDKHLYFRDMTWKVNIDHGKAKFIFKIGDDESANENDFFLQGVKRYVISELWKKYGPLYDVDTEFSKDVEGKDLMILTVDKNEEERRKRLEKIPAGAPDSASFITKSSVSRM